MKIYCDMYTYTIIMNIYHKIPIYVTHYVIFYWTATLLSEWI